MNVETETKTLLQVAHELNLSVASEFVPFGKSHNAGNKDRSLNWRVTLRRDGRDIVTTDYSAGIAHCPAYKRLKMGFGRTTIEQQEAIEFETEKGREYRSGSTLGIGGAAIVPSSLDVISSLAMDADVLEYSSFEDWAENFGYDPDSRKAETIWKACVEIALKLRSGLGNDALEALQQAASEY
jgi:hypothetical protein